MYVVPLCCLVWLGAPLQRAFQVEGLMLRCRSAATAEAAAGGGGGGGGRGRIGGVDQQGSAPLSFPALLLAGYTAWGLAWLVLRGV